MRLSSYEIQRSTSERTDILDLTEDVAARLRESGVQQGVVIVFVPGSTAGITTIEYEEGVVEDLRRAIDRMAPRDMDYLHDRRWGDGNGYSHVRAALLGPSLSVPVMDGQLRLGTWQQVVLVDCDNRPRRRQILVEVMGQ